MLSNIMVKVVMSQQKCVYVLGKNRQIAILSRVLSRRIYRRPRAQMIVIPWARAYIVVLSMGCGRMGAIRAAVAGIYDNLVLNSL